MTLFNIFFGLLKESTEMQVWYIMSNHRECNVYQFSLCVYGNIEVRHFQQFLYGQFLNTENYAAFF
jgi:hypothetical protein